MKLIICIILASINLTFAANTEKNKMKEDKNFKYQTEQFADLAILRYQVPGFDKLSLKDKELVYYLYQAALSGRDIFYDQNNKNNLKIRKTIEAVTASYKGNKRVKEYQNFLVYAKRVWFSNGIHHHYASRKFTPDITKEYLAALIKNTDKTLLPLGKGESIDKFIEAITPVILDPKLDEVKVNLDANVDMVKNSAGNFYEGVTQKEVEEFYSSMEKKDDPTPIWYGLNSKVVKENGKLTEKVWKVGGMYSPAIEKIVYWLEKAVTVASSDIQKQSLEKLIEYYKTGDLRTWDEYNILWVKDTTSVVDNVNGFIEVYEDPLGHKACYEAMVSIKDFDATKRIEAISSQAQWFEDHSPIAQEYKKKNVVGISAKVINVVVESGDSSPSTPIGVNLPNSTWIRKIHGSKSVTLGNITYAYDMAASDNVLKEFCYSKEEIELAKKYGSLSDNLHTDLHEVIGHASGQIKDGVATPKLTLKNYASTIEEARADLTALYYIIDKKLVDIGVMTTTDAGKAAYNKFIRNGLMLQLQRIKPGDNIEESHMRNRQLIAEWVYEKGKADNIIEKKIKNNKTYYVINNYEKLRGLFGQLLKEIQRITSEGDYEAAKALVENYGVKVDGQLHKEVLERYAKLNIAPYKGFINPELKPVYKNGKIVDVKVTYPSDFTKQMMKYGKEYSFLPVNN